MEKSNVYPFNGRYILMTFLLVFGMIFLLRLVQQPVIDWDEEVYLHLSKQMSWSLKNYTTQNSHIDRELPQAYYQSPLYHHPPLVPIGIKLLSFADPVTGAKILNIILWGASILLVYAIAYKLSDLTGALLALVLWVVCPITNLEARLIHLDFPATVFMLLGLWLFLQYQDQAGRRMYLFGSGLAFALAMLTKYTGPLLVAVPALIFISERGRLSDWRAWVVFGGALSLGFCWWLYIVIRFGSILPPGFSENLVNQHVTPYLKSISKRQWYDIWIYFAAICPLFLVYLGGIATKLLDMIAKRTTLTRIPTQIRPLVATNAGIWIFVLLFSLINIQTNGYWIFRHIMPFFPVVYISLGVMMSRILARDREVMSSLFLAGILITLVTMISSTAVTGLEMRNLKPVPVSLFWLQLGHLFH